MVVNEIHKPPVLRRATLRLMCVAALAVIVYGTLGPLGLGARPWIVPVETWQWVPPKTACDLNDFVTNFVVYVPVGVALRLLVRRRGTAGWPDFLLGLGLSVALSYATEVLQQALPSRSSSLTDVHVNSLAALCGCLIAVPVQRLIRRVHTALFVRLHRPWDAWHVLAWIAIALTAAVMTAPWSLKPPAGEAGFDRPAELADLRRLGTFAMVGFLVGGAARSRHASRLRSAPAALAAVAAVAVVLEAGQAVLAAHVCSLRDALVGILGGVVGVASAVGLLPHGARAETAAAHARTPSLLTRVQSATPVRAAAYVALVALLSYLVLTSLLAGGPPQGVRSAPAVQWIPFAHEFAVPFHHTIAEIVEQVALYTVITLLCLFVTGGAGRGTALLLLGATLGGIETCLAFVDGRAAHVTPLLLALLAWSVAVRTWHVLQPAPHTRPSTPSQPAAEESAFRRAAHPAAQTR